MAAVESQAEPAPARNPLLTLAALVVIVFGFRELSAVLLPICFALFLAVLGSVPMRWLIQRGVPSKTSAVLVALSVGGIIYLLSLAFQVAVTSFAKVVPTYQPRVEELFADAVAWFASIGIDLDAGKPFASLNPSTWIRFGAQSLGGALGLLSGFVLAVIGMFFVLFEIESLRARMRDRLGASYDEERLGGLLTDLQRYVGVKTVTSGLTGALVFTMNAVAGVGFAGLWGLLAFVLNFIPFIGSTVAAVPAVLVAIVDPALGWEYTLPLTIGYLVINQTISNLVEPAMMGQGLGISPFAVLLSLVFWGWLWGIGGMFLAVPLTLVVGLLLRDNRDLRFLSALIGHR